MFKIFYSGNKIFDSEVDPGLPPARDVQIIAQDDNRVGVYLQSGSDYYVLDHDTGKWRGCDIFGLFDWLLESGQVLFGRTITNQEYQAIYQRAKLEKTTWKTGERKP